MVNDDAINDFEYSAILYPFNSRVAIRIVEGNRSIEEYCRYIRTHNIRQAEIIMPDIDFIATCPSLEYLRIIPSRNAQSDFDFSPLYKMPKLKYLNCVTQYGNSSQYSARIDYSQIQGLEYLCVGVTPQTKGIHLISTLKTLNIGGFQGKSRDLTDLSCSRGLDTLRMAQCGIHSLNGIEFFSSLKCLYLNYNRSLCDITALSGVKKTLKSLRIENCSRIDDFSVLEELENLELLDLHGNNTLPNLNFIKGMKNLKTFVFSMNVLDGNLSPCLNLSYVYSLRNRKHFNLADKDLPKMQYYRGNENIEEWRRLE